MDEIHSGVVKTFHTKGKRQELTRLNRCHHTGTMLVCTKGIHPIVVEMFQSGLSRRKTPAFLCPYLQ